MKTLFAAGCAILLILVVCQWVEGDSIKGRLKRSEEALLLARREALGAGAEAAQVKQKLEDAEAALRVAGEQLARAQRAMSAAQPSGASSSPPEKAAANSQFIENLVSLAEKASRLDRSFRSFPELEIPELALLDEADWIKVVSGNAKLETPSEIRRALQTLVTRAKERAADVFREAVRKTSAANVSTAGGLAPLMEELRSKMTDSILQRYDVLHASGLEPSWIDNPRVRSHLPKDNQDVAIVVREKVSSKERQSVLVFFALPQTMEAQKRFISSASFWLDAELPP